jgi:hypothetical protein
VFDFDKAAMQRFENAPWDLRLMLSDHGFDPMLGALTASKLVDAFLRFAGGIGVDLETGMAVRAGDWRNESHQAFSVKKHVAVRARETSPGRYRVRTYGLCKFKRPELEARGLPLDMVEAAREILFDAAEQAAFGALYEEGDSVGSSHQPLVLVSAPKDAQDPPGREVLMLTDQIGGRETSQGALRGLRALRSLKG